MKIHHHLLVMWAIAWMAIPFSSQTSHAACPQGQLEWIYWYGGAPHAQCGCTIENPDIDPATGKPIPWIVDRAAPMYFANKQFGTDWSYDLTQGVTTSWYYAADGGAINGVADGFTTSTPIIPINGPTLLNDTQDWIATKTVPVYVTGEKLGTLWKNFPGPIDDNAMAACNALYTNCAENQYYDKYLEACVVKSSTPPPTTGQCAVYDKATPTAIWIGDAYNVKACDKILFSNELGKSVVTIGDISSKTVDIKVQSNVFGSVVQYTRTLNAVDSPENYSYLYKIGHANIYGHDLLLISGGLSSTGETAKLYTSKSCLDTFNVCKTFWPITKECYTLCNPAAAYTNPDNGKAFDFDYSPPYTTAISAPDGYSKAVTTAAIAADCVRSKLKNLFGVDDSKPTTITYVPDNADATAEEAGCSNGGKFGNVECILNSNYSDSLLTALNPSETSIKINSTMVKFNQKAQQGCEIAHSNGFVTSGLPHEMTHNFAMNNFYIMNSEGLASFAEYEMSTGIEKLECGETGYKGNGTFFPYEKWATNVYKTGACFLRELRDTYGPETFKKIFQYAHTLKTGQYHLFKDIIHPIVNDNFYDKVKTKYGFTEDPLLTQSVQHFFD